MMDRLPFVLACAAGAVGATLLLAAAAPAALAADASPWDGGTRSAVRLIAGAAAGNRLRAGVEIRLAPGWKTYWRYPGDSGVPPSFRLARSENVASFSVLWPAPQSFADGSGRSIGYKERVIFPLHIVPIDAGKPVVLRLDLDYAVCEKLCAPVDAKAELMLDGRPSAHESTLARSEARVPKSAALGDGGPLAIRAVTRDAGGSRARVLVDVAAPDGHVELFAEGPTPDWVLPVPEPVAGAPAGLRRFAFDLDGLPAGASADRVTLRFTAVADEAAIEVAAPLD